MSFYSYVVLGITNIVQTLDGLSDVISFLLGTCPAHVILLHTKNTC